MRRLALIAGLALPLAACGEDAGKAFLDSRPPPAVTPRFWAPDGWAWGVIRVEGTPEIRYGVASPPVRPKGHVVFVTAYGESAEVYFETAHDLIERGFAVWVMEPHGQGGSGRFPGPRDVGRSAGFERDAEALIQLVTKVIRPEAGQPVVVAATGSGALPVLLAAGQALPATAVALWSPELAPRDPGPMSSRMARVGLGMLRASGGAWQRPTGSTRTRAALPKTWQMANPDLRMGGPGHSWVAAQADAVGRVMSAGWTGARAPLSLRSSPADAAGRALCARSPACRGDFTVSGLDGPLSDGARRKAWLAALTDLLEPPAPGQPEPAPADAALPAP